MLILTIVFICSVLLFNACLKYKLSQKTGTMGYLIYLFAPRGFLQSISLKVH